MEAVEIAKLAGQLGVSGILGVVSWALWQDNKRLREQVSQMERDWRQELKEATAAMSEALKNFKTQTRSYSPPPR